MTPYGPYGPLWPLIAPYGLFLASAKQSLVPGSDRGLPQAARKAVDPASPAVVPVQPPSAKDTDEAAGD